MKYMCDNYFFMLDQKYSYCTVSDPDEYNIEFVHNSMYVIYTGINYVNPQDFINVDLYFERVLNFYKRYNIIDVPMYAELFSDFATYAYTYFGVPTKELAVLFSLEFK